MQFFHPICKLHQTDVSDKRDITTLFNKIIEKYGRAVLFLCSDEASFITGHPLSVDGGYVAQ
ncbi:putative oxidoreductase [Calothrix sp. NIES-4071]|nr:putative oxidoreductase [Calothrix sp. NIES-4071]BAZ57815.1 putative oxidoreductase [Calothrix sp. NIES-4105]